MTLLMKVLMRTIIMTQKMKTIDKNIHEIESEVVIKQSERSNNLSLNELNFEEIENNVNDMTFSEDNDQNINNENDSINKEKVIYEENIINTERS
jgi:hypothetical protein